MHDTRIISKFDIDFDTLVALATKALGRNPAKAADASPRKLSKPEKFISILDSILSEHSEPALHRKLLGFVDVTVVFGIEAKDTLDLLNHLSGMEFFTTGVNDFADFGLMKGTLAEWRDAIISGTNAENSEVQGCFCKLYSQFESAGLRLWTDCVARRQSGTSLIRLELK